VYVKVAGLSGHFACGVVVYDCQGEPFEKGQEVSGTFQFRTVGYNDPRSRKLVPARSGVKTSGVGKYLGALKRSGGTGRGFFAKTPEKGTQGKLAPYAVAVRLLVPGDNEFGAFIDELYEGRRYR
jgi:hypothetical protein